MTLNGYCRKRLSINSIKLFNLIKYLKEYNFKLPKSFCSTAMTLYVVNNINIQVDTELQSHTLA